MTIIGFSNKTNSLWVRLVCRHFKHCAIITGHDKKFVLHQFVARHNIAKIAITTRGIAQLNANGWFFIYLSKYTARNFNLRARTCVHYAKSALRIKKIWIQTPYSLYKYIQKNLT